MPATRRDCRDSLRVGKTVRSEARIHQQRVNPVDVGERHVRKGSVQISPVCLFHSLAHAGPSMTGNEREVGLVLTSGQTHAAVTSETDVGR